MKLLLQGLLLPALTMPVSIANEDTPIKTIEEAAQAEGAAPVKVIKKATPLNVDGDGKVLDFADSDSDAN